MRILLTGVSGSIGAALAARAGARGPRAARPVARPGARRASACRCCAATRSAATGLDEALEGVDVAYFLIHSMEGADARLRGARARGGARTSSPPRSAPACAARSTSAASCRPARRRRATSPAAWRSSGSCSRGLPEVGRAARLDRHRRALALVSLPRAPRRAHARAGAARVARATARSRSTCATCARSSSPPRRRRTPPAACRWTSPARRRSPTRRSIERIAELMLVRRPALRHRSRRHADRRADRRARSPARTRASSGR